MREVAVRSRGATLVVPKARFGMPELRSRVYGFRSLGLYIDASCTGLTLIFHEPLSEMSTSLAMMSILAASCSPTKLAKMASMMGFMPEETMTTGTSCASHHL